MITSINKVSYPNTLIVILAQGDGESNFEEKADVTRVTDGKGELTGFNFFNVDQVLTTISCQTAKSSWTKTKSQP